MKRLLLLAVLAGILTACEGLSEYFPTYTPAPTETPYFTETPANTATLDVTATPEFQTPTPICGEAGCDEDLPEATPLGYDPYQFTVEGRWSVQCIAVNGCLIRTAPVSESYTARRAVVYGTTVTADQRYHCEVYSFCDKQYRDWYHLTTGEWIANLGSVWRVISQQ